MGYNGFIYILFLIMLVRYYYLAYKERGLITQPPYIFINMGKTESKGLGDTIEKMIETFKIKKIIGNRDCQGCKARKDTLNKLFPYKNTKQNNT